MPKVSVIVPVYGTEKYLDKCLNSLVNQTLNDIEIIVVNDGSPDNSQKIIDSYVKNYPDKVFSFKKKNGGLSDARNYGIKKANGEYIGFVDSDDFADKDMFKKMYDKASSGNFDVCVCDVKYIFESKTKVVSSLVDADVKTSDELKKAMVNIYPAAWNKIYKRELFKYVEFKKGVWYEDVEFLYKLFPYVKSICTVKTPLINYVQRENSIINTYDERVYHYIDNFNGILKFYKNNNFFDKYYDEIEFVYMRYLFQTFTKAACNFDKLEYNLACAKALDNVLNNFPNYKKNKYIKGLKGFYLKHYGKFFNNILYLILGGKHEK